jgi:hypothetical protein
MEVAVEKRTSVKSPSYQALALHADIMTDTGVHQRLSASD